MKLVNLMLGRFFFFEKKNVLRTNCSGKAATKGIGIRSHVHLVYVKYMTVTDAEFLERTKHFPVSQHGRKTR